MLLEAWETLLAATVLGGGFLLLILVCGIVQKRRLRYYLVGIGAALCVFVLADVLVGTFVVYPRYNYEFTAKDESDYSRQIAGKSRTPIVPIHATDMRVLHSVPSWVVSCMVRDDDFADFSGLWQEKADLKPRQGMPDLAEEMARQVGIQSLDGFTEFYQTPTAQSGRHMAVLHDPTKHRVLVYALRW